jgi:hypothetical protein
VKTKEQTLTPARKKIVKPGRPIIQKMRLHIQPGKTTENSTFTGTTGHADTGY